LILCKSITAGYGYEQEEILLVMEIVAGDLVSKSDLVKMLRSFLFFLKEISVERMLCM